MYSIIITIIIIIIVIVNQYIYYDTNNLIKYHFISSNKPKIVILGSLHGNESTFITM